MEISQNNNVVVSTQESDKSQNKNLSKSVLNTYHPIDTSITELYFDADKRKHTWKNEQLFPFIGDKDKMNNLLIDNESLMYISRRNDASLTTNIICDHLKKFDCSSFETTILDMTAGTGGNTLSFGSKFKLIYAIEIDEIRAKYLKNNVDIYGFNNIVVVQADSTKHIASMLTGSFDVGFIDPPWGGKFYKEFDSVKLSLSDISLEKIINDMFTNQHPKIVCVKLPKNYDIYYFYCQLNKYKIYMYTLNKMIIMVIENYETDKNIYSLKNLKKIL